MPEVSRILRRRDFTPRMLDRNKLVLASGSPRRQQLLREAGIGFDVHPAQISEAAREGEKPLPYALRVARDKAMEVARRFPGRWVLAADTIVVLEDMILGKPRNGRHAVEMLRMLSGRSHEVITAVSLVAPGRDAETQYLTTEVEFRPVTEEEIQEYVAGGEPMDKAGAYAIQGGAARWVNRVAGDYSNVVGLPLPLVTKMLTARGFLQS